jgi:hypothetical protein
MVPAGDSGRADIGGNSLQSRLLENRAGDRGLLGNQDLVPEYSRGDADGQDCGEREHHSIHLCLLSDSLLFDWSVRCRPRSIPMLFFVASPRARAIGFVHHRPTDQRPQAFEPPEPVLLAGPHPLDRAGDLASASRRDAHDERQGAGW